MIDSIAPQHLEANSRSFSATMADRNNKRKRRPAGTPDPDAEVVALSPRTLMESDRYVCEICNQGFQRDQNLQMHRRRHKVPWKLLKRPTPDIKKRVYVCPDPTCLHNDPAHALGDLVGIKKHFRRKHSLEKQWKCEKCSKGYAVQSDYKAHLKTCGTRGHSCDCGRVFSRVESFIEHQDNCSTAKERAVLSYSDRPVTYTNNNSTTRRPPMLGEELPFLSSSPWKRFTTENQPQSAQKKDDSNMVLQLNLSVGATKENDQNPLGIMITNGRNSSCLSHANGGTDRSNKHWADFLASPSKRTKPSIESKEREGLSEATTTEPELANATSSVSDSRCSGTTEKSSSSKDETHHVFLQNHINPDAERVKEMANRQLEIAEAEFAMARKIEAEAQLMLRRANILRGEAMRHINETTMEITCQSCRQQFFTMVSPPCENKMNLDLNIGHASSETRPPHFYSPPK